MNLKEMVNTMMPSDRLIVKDTYGEELYRGYAAKLAQEGRKKHENDNATNESAELEAGAKRQEGNADQQTKTKRRTAVLHPGMLKR